MSVSVVYWLTHQIDVVILMTMMLCVLAATTARVSKNIKLFEQLRLVYDDSEKIKIHLRGSSALSVNFPKLVINHTALDSASWTLDETDTETAKTKAGGFYIPVQKNGDDWYVCLNRGHLCHNCAYQASAPFLLQLHPVPVHVPVRFCLVRIQKVI